MFAVTHCSVSHTGRKISRKNEGRFTPVELETVSWRSQQTVPFTMPNDCPSYVSTPLAVYHFGISPSSNFRSGDPSSRSLVTRGPSNGSRDFIHAF